LSEYAASKLFAEAGLSKIATELFHVYLLRNATAYGASPVLRTDLVVNDLSAGICANGIAEIKSDGSPWRPLIHCLDMARAFKEFIEKDPIKLNGKPVNVGFSTENYQVKDIGIMLEKVWDACKVNYLNQSTNDPRDYQVDFTLLQESLPNFFIGTNLKQGILELKEFLLQIKYSNEDRENKKFVRIEELKDNLNVLS
jgi:nucleoside-diphosphate-sugar epimerase